jgi:hypothetical protein
MPRGRELAHVVAGVERAAFVNADAPTAARWKGVSLLKVALKRLLSWHFRYVIEQISVLGLLIARALATLTNRLESLESRVASLEAPEAARTVELPPEPVGARPDLQPWAKEVQTLLSSVAGRILYADPDAVETLARLRAAGLDAYGLSPYAPDQQESPDVRRGQLLAHLESVDDGALAGIVLVGSPDAMDGPALAVLVADLARVIAAGGRVVVVGQSPWWWRERLGPIDSDLADRRPLSPETWIVSLNRAGFQTTAHYAADAHSYVVVADRNGETLHNRPAP